MEKSHEPALSASLHNVSIFIRGFTRRTGDLAERAVAKKKDRAERIIRSIKKATLHWAHARIKSCCEGIRYIIYPLMGLRKKSRD